MSAKNRFHREHTVAEWESRIKDIQAEHYSRIVPIDQPTLAIKRRYELAFLHSWYHWNCAKLLAGAPHGIIYLNLAAKRMRNAYKLLVHKKAELAKPIDYHCSQYLFKGEAHVRH